MFYLFIYLYSVVHITYLLKFSSLDPEQLEKLNIEDENLYEFSQEVKQILYVLDKNVKLGMYFLLFSYAKYIIY